MASEDGPKTDGGPRRFLVRGKRVRRDADARRRRPWRAAVAAAPATERSIALDDLGAFWDELPHRPSSFGASRSSTSAHGSTFLRERKAERVRCHGHEGAHVRLQLAIIELLQMHWAARVRCISEAFRGGMLLAPGSHEAP
jgi:hypothetical protein